MRSTRILCAGASHCPTPLRLLVGAFTVGSFLLSLLLLAAFELT